MTVTETSESIRAERKLAALLLADLDVDVTPAQVRSFIKARWSTIAPLAHIIHAAPDYTKSQSGGGGAGASTGYASP